MTSLDSRSIEAERYRILLRVCQAANGELELNHVLSELVKALSPVVPLDGIGVTVLENDMLVPRAIHMEGVSHRTGERFHEVLGDAIGQNVVPEDTQFPLSDSPYAELAKTGKVLVVQDLEAEARYEMDRRLLRYGIRSAVRAPLILRGQLLGSAAYIRLKKQPFTDEQVAILQDLAPIVATAVANALAYEEVARLKNRLQQENRVLREELDERGMFEEIVGSSPGLRRVLGQIQKVAPTDSTVLILGETGVGKELIARAVHRGSSRAERAMIKVNCAMLPSSLVASELFGHEKGAFTGATQRRIGRFELAAGGSIFLDEVGELPPEMQLALLRVLQEKEFERVGGTQTIRTDARVIAATNRDLLEAVAEGSFRSDLFYRLNVFPIVVPPLRDRVEDIPVLVEYFAARHGTRTGRQFCDIDPETMARLVAYPWPGNVRECENVIERAVILSETALLSVDPSLLGPIGRSRAALATPTPARSSLHENEKRLIEEALTQSRGLISGTKGAAKRLQIPASTLESKIKKYGIDKYRFRSLMV